MRKYIVKIELREAMSTSEAKKTYYTRADMNKDIYATDNCGYTNEICQAKQFTSYSDAMYFAHGRVFGYSGHYSLIAKVVACEVVIAPIEEHDIEMSTYDKLELAVCTESKVTFEDDELEKYVLENQNDRHRMYLYGRYMEKISNNNE